MNPKYESSKYQLDNRTDKRTFEKATFINSKLFFKIQNHNSPDCSVCLEIIKKFNY